MRRRRYICLLLLLLLLPDPSGGMDVTVHEKNDWFDLSRWNIQLGNGTNYSAGENLTFVKTNETGQTNEAFIQTLDNWSVYRNFSFDLEFWNGRSNGFTHYFQLMGENNTPLLILAVMGESRANVRDNGGYVQIAELIWNWTHNFGVTGTPEGFNITIQNSTGVQYYNLSTPVQEQNVTFLIRAAYASGSLAPFSWSIDNFSVVETFPDPPIWNPHVGFTDSHINYYIRPWAGYYATWTNETCNITAVLLGGGDLQISTFENGTRSLNGTGFIFQFWPQPETDYYLFMKYTNMVGGVSHDWYNFTTPSLELYTWIPELISVEEEEVDSSTIRIEFVINESTRLYFFTDLTTCSVIQDVRTHHNVTCRALEAGETHDYMVRITNIVQGQLYYNGTFRIEKRLVLMDYIEGVDPVVGGGGLIALIILSLGIRKRMRRGKTWFTASPRTDTDWDTIFSMHDDQYGLDLERIKASIPVRVCEENRYLLGEIFDLEQRLRKDLSEGKIAQVRFDQLILDVVETRAAIERLIPHSVGN